MSEEACDQRNPLQREAGKTIPATATAKQQSSPEESRERLEAGPPQRGGGGRGKLLHNNGVFIRGRGCAK